MGKCQLCKVRQTPYPEYLKRFSNVITFHLKWLSSVVCGAFLSLVQRPNKVKGMYCIVSLSFHRDTIQYIESCIENNYQ